jgi:hypothetical protein
MKVWAEIEGASKILVPWIRSACDLNYLWPFRSMQITPKTGRHSQLPLSQALAYNSSHTTRYGMILRTRICLDHDPSLWQDKLEDHTNCSQHVLKIPDAFNLTLVYE